MRYFPLTHDRFEHQFGIRALPSGESILETTESYDDEIALKRQLLQEDPANYFQALPGSESTLMEAASLIARSAAPTLTIEFDSNPLLSVARHVQEDLAILSGDASAGHPVIGGVVCFPSGWTIRDKIGESILSVHRPVPEYASVMGRSTDRLLEQLKPERSVWRMNWGVRGSGRLDQSPKQTKLLEQDLAGLSAANVDRRCHFRVERQTLSRLRDSGGILFTIHTHQCPLCELADWQKRNLLGVLETCPTETLRYKSIAPIKELVCEYLRGGNTKP